MEVVITSEAFIYLVLKEDNKIIEPHFCIAKKGSKKILLKILLFNKFDKKNFQRLICIKDSPKHLKNLSKKEKQEILTTLKFKEDFEFAISNYERLIIAWNKQNPDNEIFYETPLEEEGFLLTPFNKEDTNLPMIVNLRCIHFKDENEIFLRFQNDRENKMNCNYIKMMLDGTIINEQNQKIVFNEDELNMLKSWIKLNKNIIKNHWNGKIDSLDALEACKKYEVEDE